MPAVLTIASTLSCAHGGTLVVQASTRALTAGGNPVLVQADLLAATIPDCPNKNPPSQTPCLKVTSVLAGASTGLTVAGQPVMLETAQGLTNGTPAPATWQVRSAGQTLLEAP